MLTAFHATDAVLGAAIEVHRRLGPGLLEAAYQLCLEHELRLRGVPFESQIVVPLTYKDLYVPGAYRLDLVVDGTALIELKAVAQVLPVHRAQVLTYLKATGLPVGLLLNFNEPRLKDGICRLVL